MKKLLESVKRAEADGDFASARQFLLQAVEEQPENAVAWFKLGLSERELGHFDVAVNALRRSLELDEGLFVAVYRGLAGCFHDQDKLAEANEAYQHIPAESFTPSMLILWAAVLVRLGKPTNAEELLLRALREEPNNDEALTNLAIIYRETRSEEAIELLKRAISSDPQNPVAHREFGFLLSKLGQTKQADEHLQCSLKIDPDNYWTWLYLGANDRTRGAFDKAEKNFKYAHQLQPKDALPLTFLGDLYRQQNKLVEAEQSYLTAMRLADLFPNPHLKLARLYKEQGRIAEAFDHINQALTLNPSDPDAIAFKRELNAENSD